MGWKGGRRERGPLAWREPPVDDEDVIQRIGKEGGLFGPRIVLETNYHNRLDEELKGWGN